MISFILVNYLNYEVTKTCVKSIINNLKNQKTDYEIIIIDNASPNNSGILLSKLYESTNKIKVVVNQKNLGFGKANNIGVCLAKSDKLIFVNTDVYFEKFDFALFSNLLDNLKDVGMLSCKILYPDSTIQSIGNELPTYFNLFKNYIMFNNSKVNKNRRYKNYKNIGIRNCAWCSGSFFACKKENYLTVGGFDENIFLYGEDLELGIHFLNSKFKNYVADNFEVFHLHGASNNLSKPSYSKIRENKLNDLYVFKKYNLFKNMYLIKFFIEVNALIIFLRANTKWLLSNKSQEKE